MSMERVRVGDVLRLERLAVDPTPDKEYVSIGIRSFGKGIFHYEAKTGDRLGSLRFFEMRPERLVVSNIKGREGAIAVSDDSDVGCVASNRFLSYVPVAEHIDVRWALWYFLSEPGISLIQRASPGSADRNRTLAIDRFEALEIPLPPLEDQQRVAARLDQVAFATERIGSLASTAATQRAALIDALVHGAATPRRSVALGEVMSLAIDHQEVELEQAYEIAGVYSFGRGLFTRGRIDGTGTKYKVLHRLRAGQLVMSRLKAWEGAIGVVPEELDGYFLSPEFPTFDPGPELSSRYLDLLVRTRRFWESLASGSKGVGARRERVGAERLLQQVVELPAVPAQEAIAGLVSSVQLAQSKSLSRARLAEALVPSALNEAFGSLR